MFLQLRHGDRIPSSRRIHLEKFRKSTCRRFSAITSAVRHGIFENLLLPKTLVEAVYPELCFGEC